MDDSQSLEQTMSPETSIELYLRSQHSYSDENYLTILHNAGLKDEALEREVLSRNVEASEQESVVPTTIMEEDELAQ